MRKNFSRMMTTALLLCAASLLIGGCSSGKEKRPPPAEINGFPPSYMDNSKINPMRAAILRDAAVGLGAQSGLAWESARINQMLERDDRTLNKVFNFRALLINQNVLPPVLSTGDNALVLDDPNTLRLADRIYKIESPPRFVTAPPIWRDYLWMTYTPPEKPHAALLPRTIEERAVWNEFVIEGWREGIAQANQIFSANMGRLKRDFTGMVLYKKLLEQKMVTAPYVAQTDLGITGDENQIRINDQVLRITSTSRLVPNSKKWKAVPVPGTEGAIRRQGPGGVEATESVE